MLLIKNPTLVQIIWVAGSLLPSSYPSYPFVVIRKMQIDCFKIRKNLQFEVHEDKSFIRKIMQGFQKNDIIQKINKKNISLL